MGNLKNKADIDNYKEKKELLEAAGWSDLWHPDNWVSPKAKNTPGVNIDRAGCSMDAAFKSMAKDILFDLPQDDTPCSLEVAKILKILGFDKPVTFYHRTKNFRFAKAGLSKCKDDEVLNHNEYDDFIYSAPANHEARQWAINRTVITITPLDNIKDHAVVDNDKVIKKKFDCRMDNLKFKTGSQVRTDTLINASLFDDLLILGGIEYKILRMTTGVL